jgi:hypothetical protein
MSESGLGGVKTRASAARVEYLGGIARRECQIMLRPCGATPDWRIVFFTFRRCMSFHTGWVKSGHSGRAWSSINVRSCPKADGHVA